MQDNQSNNTDDTDIQEIQIINKKEYQLGSLSQAGGSTKNVNSAKNSPAQRSQIPYNEIVQNEVRKIRSETTNYKDHGNNNRNRDSNKKISTAYQPQKNNQPQVHFLLDDQKSLTEEQYKLQANRMKIQNDKLRLELKSLNDKLTNLIDQSKPAIVKRQRVRSSLNCEDTGGNQNTQRGEYLMRKQLENAYKLVNIYQKQNQQLTSKVYDETTAHQKIVKLENDLRAQNQRIEALTLELKGLLRVKQNQQIALQNGMHMDEKEKNLQYQHNMLNENMRLKQKLKEMQKEKEKVDVTYQKQHLYYNDVQEKYITLCREIGRHPHLSSVKNLIDLKQLDNNHHNGVYELDHLDKQKHHHGDRSSPSPTDMHKMNNGSTVDDSNSKNYVTQEIEEHQGDYKGGEHGSLIKEQKTIKKKNMHQISIQRAAAAETGQVNETQDNNSSIAYVSEGQEAENEELEFNLINFEDLRNQVKILTKAKKISEKKLNRDIKELRKFIQKQSAELFQARNKLADREQENTIIYNQMNQIKRAVSIHTSNPTPLRPKYVERFPSPLVISPSGKPKNFELVLNHPHTTRVSHNGSLTPINGGSSSANNHHHHSSNNNANSSETKNTTNPVNNTQQDGSVYNREKGQHKPQIRQRQTTMPSELMEYNQTVTGNTQTNFETSTRDIQNKLLEEPYPQTLFQQKLDTIQKDQETIGHSSQLAMRDYSPTKNMSQIIETKDRFRLPLKLTDAQFGIEKENSIQFNDRMYLKTKYILKIVYIQVYFNEIGICGLKVHYRDSESNETLIGGDDVMKTNHPMNFLEFEIFSDDFLKDLAGTSDEQGFIQSLRFITNQGVIKTCGDQSNQGLSQFQLSIPRDDIPICMYCSITPIFSSSRDQMGGILTQIGFQCVSQETFYFQSQVKESQQHL